MKTHFRTISTLLLASIPMATLPGCIVWDINDGILASNDNLGRIEDELSAIDEHLSVVNENMSTIDNQMTSMGSTLTSMDLQLKNLQTQLAATNKNLESLRKTINNIDNTIPFLKLSGDDEEEQEALENGESSLPVDEASEPASQEPRVE